MNERLKEEIAAPPEMLGYRVYPLESLTLSGWVDASIDPKLLKIAVICNGIDLNRNIVRSTIKGDTGTGGEPYSRVSFKLVLPGYVWEFAGPDGCVLEVLVNGNKLAFDGNVLTREDLKAVLDNCLAPSSKALPQKLRVILIEHIRYSGLLPELTAAQLGYMNGCAQKLGLELLLHAGML